MQFKFSFRIADIVLNSTLIVVTILNRSKKGEKIINGHRRALFNFTYTSRSKSGYTL